MKFVSLNGLQYHNRMKFILQTSNIIIVTVDDLIVKKNFS